MANLIRKALERLQYEEVPVVSESTGIIPHTPEVSYREERGADRAQAAETPSESPFSSTRPGAAVVASP